jgi:hypothetical protein
LAKRPEDRFASAADFAAAMQSILQGAAQLPPELARGSRIETRTIPGELGERTATVHGPPPPASDGMQGLAPASGPAAVQVAAAPRTNVAFLVGIAVAFLLLGIGLAVLVMKLVLR